MKVNIVAVGKIKEKFFTEAINEYAKRLSKFCEFSVVEVDEATTITNIEQKKEKEGDLLLSKAKGYIIALDGGGKLVSSEDLASIIKNNMVGGVNEFSFVIGGSNGLSNAVKLKANLVLSFGKITFPHQLFRVVLSEQIYRAFAINNHINYHK